MKAVQVEIICGGSAVEAAIVEDMPLETVQRAEEQWLIYKREASQSWPPERKHPASGEWRWQAKIRGTGPEAHRFFFLLCEDVIEGMMMISRRPIPSRSQKVPQGCLYIEYIESAPWNVTQYAGLGPRYKGIGTQLLRLAFHLSIEAGSQGRLALHSLSESESFYSKLGMVDLGDDPEEDGLRYFEGTPNFRKER